jgi:cell division protein FtsQ
MASSSKRSSGSSGRKPERKRVIITPERSRDGANSQRRSPTPKSKRQVEGGTSSRRPNDTQGATSKPHDPKRSARETRLARQRRAMRIRVALVVALIIGMVAGTVSLYRSNVFSITEIEVEGLVELTAADVIAVAALPEDSTLLRFPRGEMEVRLAEHPWIAAAHISRRFPEGLVIHVEERTPAALVDTGEAAFWLVDDGAMVLGQRTPETTETVMVIRDLTDFEPVAGERSESPSLANALLVLDGLSDKMLARVRAISAASVDLTTLITVDDVEVLVGSAEDIEKKDAVALRIMEEQAETVVHINVRTVDRPTWRGLDSGQ